jgi:hypothetical protein
LHLIVVVKVRALKSKVVGRLDDRSRDTDGIAASGRQASLKKVTEISSKADSKIQKSHLFGPDSQSEIIAETSCPGSRAKQYRYSAA